MRSATFPASTASVRSAAGAESPGCSLSLLLSAEKAEGRGQGPGGFRITALKKQFLL